MFETLRGALTAPVLAGLLVSGCTTTSTAVIRPTPSDLPQFTVRSYDAPNACIRKFSQSLLETRREKILFLVGGLGDLTKNERDWTSGPMTFAGPTMLKEQLSRYGGPRVQLQGVTSIEVRDYVSLGREFGLAEIVKLQRQYDANRIFLLTGGFVAFDQARTSGGKAGSAGYRDDDVDIQAETGQGMESGRIDFILEITDVMTNRLLGTISLSGTERRRSASTKFTLEVRGIGVGFASQNVEVDGTHNVQASIIAAAHFYLWQMILPGDEEAKCLTDPATSPSRFAATMNAYEAAGPRGKVALLQTALNRMFGKTRAPLAVDGLVGAATLAAVRAAEAQLGLAPAGRGDFATLYGHLLRKGYGQ